MRLKISLPICLILALAGLAHADSKDYLKLRREYGIQSALTLDELNGMVGKRVVEIQAIVKGTFKVGDMQSLLIEGAESNSLTIEGTSMPEWLSNGEVKARILVEASRPGLNSPLITKFIAAAPESEIAKVDAALTKRRETSRTKAPTAARGGYYRVNPKFTMPSSDVTPVYAAFIKKWNHKLGANDCYKIAQCVIGFSLKKGIDPRLIMAIVMTESDFNPSCTSKAGAMGLGQLMPVNLQELGLNNAYDNTQNIYGTATLIRAHLDKYRKMTTNDYDALVLALAGYNAGDGAVKKYGGVPPYRETQNYVKKVIGYYEQLAGVRLSR